jgi:Na+-transporting NADH:ubiquinone oxidoreductase subunit C
VRQSNTYIIIFSAVLTVVLGGLLSLAAIGLRPMQDQQVALDTQKKILGAVMALQPTDDVPAIYNQRIQSLVVDINGEEIKEVEGSPVIAESVEIGKQFKLPPEQRLYPVYKFMSKDNPDQVEAYILPVYGNGLWDKIWGYIALKNDLETLQGAVFDHAGETPGLGARITDIEVQQRFTDKKIVDGAGEIVGVQMMKGETGDPSIYNENQVDGLSGSTMTAKGVNQMIYNYLTYYQAYLKKVSGGKEVEKPDLSVPETDT